MSFPIIGANFKMAVNLSGMQLLCPAGLRIPLEVPRAGSLTAAAIGVVDSPSPSLPTVEALGDSGPKGAAATPRGASRGSKKLPKAKH